MVRQKGLFPADDFVNRRNVAYHVISFSLSASPREQFLSLRGPGLERPGYKPVLSEAKVWTALTGQGTQSSGRMVRQRGVFPADDFINRRKRSIPRDSFSLSASPREQLPLSLRPSPLL
ncbi:hypothetical protein QA601_00470 [Chitinispirillales bacterium ANBcel5]|uniref:hypothetical protein n=1 Tax=Cellulosispirillum alkaliphilum TaxID=3039283 RepID=UPI002A545882|nr:hypothetical protein [Chitinispirillales bacterium ANBcel5]